MTKGPIEVVLCWAQMVRPLNPSPSRVWAAPKRLCLSRGGSLQLTWSPEGPVALPVAGVTSPSQKEALGSSALCPPRALTFKKHVLCVRPVLGHIHICSSTQFSQHSEVQVVFCILHMRRLGSCLFFLMKTQRGAIFHRWPTAWSNLPASRKEESQLFIGE